MSHKSSHIIIDARAAGHMKKLPQETQEEINAIVEKANDDVDKLLEEHEE